MDLKQLLAALLALKDRLSEGFLAVLEPLAVKVDADEATTDEELEAFKTGLTDEGKRVLAESTDDQALELVGHIKDAKQLVVSELAQRAADDAERQAQADALLAELEDPEPDPETPEGDEGEEGEGEGTEDAVEPAEGEPAVTEPEPEPVSAAGRPQARIARVNARRPVSMVAPPTVTLTDASELVLIASANSGMPAGSVIRGPEGIAEAAQRMYDHQIRRGPHNGPTEFLSMGTIKTDFPDERKMRPGDGNGHNDRVAAHTKRLVAEQQREALAASGSLVASGGNCFPLNTDFAIKTYGVRDRPLRDRFMVRTGAPRGGIRTTPPLSISLAEFADGTDFWTEANDTDRKSVV